MSFTFAHYYRNVRRLVSGRDTEFVFGCTASMLKFPDMVALIGVRVHNRSVAHI